MHNCCGRIHDALLVLVPRHPQRFDDVKAALRAKSIDFVPAHRKRCSAEPMTTVLLVDALGELTTFYAAADVAFVGGSLVPIGGHNLLEPAALGMPVLTGPHTFNSPDVATRASRARCRVEVNARSEQLAASLANLFDSRKRREHMGANALSFVTANRGALAAFARLDRAAPAIILSDNLRFVATELRTHA